MGIRDWLFENPTFNSLVAKVDALTTELAGAMGDITNLATQLGLVAGEVTAILAIVTALQGTGITCPSAENIVALMQSEAHLWVQDAQGDLNDVVELPVWIKGESNWEIPAFGIGNPGASIPGISYNTTDLQFVDIQAGNLTEDWNTLDGNEYASGLIGVGGFHGTGTKIVGEAVGVLFIVRFQIVSDQFTNSVVTFDNYVDGLVNFSPQPAIANVFYGT
jgi:hypothetical protein